MQKALGNRVVCLRGNHEAVIVAAARDELDTLPGRVSMEQWIGENGGGEPTLASYGVAHARDVSPEHLHGWPGCHCGTTMASVSSRMPAFIPTGRSTISRKTT